MEDNINIMLNLVTNVFKKLKKQQDKKPQKEIPTLVINNYLSKEFDNKIWDLLTKWTSDLLNQDLLNVVFVSNNPMALKTIEKCNQKIITIVTNMI